MNALRTVATLVFLMAPIQAVAQAVGGQSTPPAPSAPRPTQVPQAVERTLANGLRVIVVPKHDVPLVAARVMIRAGAEADPEESGGLAQATASLLTEGTTTRSAEQVARGVEALGASLESTAAWDLSRVDVSVLSSKLAEAMVFVADVVRHPTFKKEEVERQRQQTLDGLRLAMSQPSTLAAFVAARAVYGDSAYGHPSSGTLESVERMKRTDIVAFHRRFYRPDNTVVLFAGDISPIAAFRLAERLLGDWKKPTSTLPATSAPVPPPSASAAPRVLVVDMPAAGQAAVVVTRPGLSRTDGLFSTAVAANSVLGGSYSSRLNEEIRIKRGLTYDASSEFEFRRAAGPFTAASQTKNASAAEVLGLIVDEMAKLGTADVAEAELTPRKASIMGGFSRSLETSTGLVSRMSVLALYGLELGEINQYIGKLQAVTAEEIRTFSAAHLGGADATLVIVGDAKQFLEPLRKRFARVDVIALDELDLNQASLRK